MQVFRLPLFHSVSIHKSSRSSLAMRHLPVEVLALVFLHAAADETRLKTCHSLSRTSKQLHSIYISEQKRLRQAYLEATTSIHEAAFANVLFLMDRAIKEEKGQVNAASQGFDDPTRKTIDAVYTRYKAILDASEESHPSDFSFILEEHFTGTVKLRDETRSEIIRMMTDENCSDSQRPRWRYSEDTALGMIEFSGSSSEKTPESTESFQSEISLHMSHPVENQRLQPGYDGVLEFEFDAFALFIQDTVVLGGGDVVANTEGNQRTATPGAKVSRWISFSPLRRSEIEKYITRKYPVASKIMILGA